MILKILRLYLLIVSLFAVAGCGGSKATDSNEATLFPVGRELYFSKCTSCHKAYVREQYRAAVWDTIMNVMTAKAKLSQEEKTSILNYLCESDRVTSIKKKD